MRKISPKYIIRKTARAANRLWRYAEKTDAGTQKTPMARELLQNKYIIERCGKRAAAALGICHKLPAVRRGVRIFIDAEALMTENSVGARQILQHFRENEYAERELCHLGDILICAAICRLAETLEENDDAALSALIASIHAISKLDFGELIRALSPTENVLARDPSGEYLRMDDVTRATYRGEVSHIAEMRGIGEPQAASEAVERAFLASGSARHVGMQLQNTLEAMEKPHKKMLKALYFAVIAAFALIIPLLVALAMDDVGPYWQAAAFGALIMVCWEIARQLADRIFLRFLVRPEVMPAMAMEGGVPDEGRTLCVITSLMPDERTAEQLCGLLEEYYLSNRAAGENLAFGVLADLKDCKKTPEQSLDKRVIACAERAIDALNQKYGGGFCLVYRKRVLNGRDGVYMARERKRGAIEELIKLINGRENSCIVYGKPAQGIKYLLTLDADTRLTPDSARRLIGAALHPRNRPVIDAARGVVTKGYGIIQPRIDSDLASANKTFFSRIFAGHGGIDPYGASSGELYQDLFGRTIFTGKGLIDVCAYDKCLAGAIPEGKVLSHDLLEGGYLRAAQMSRVAVTDGFPDKPAGYYARLHRWVRGDVQTSPWITSRVKNTAGDTIKNPLSALTRYQIADNIRRAWLPFSTIWAMLLAMCACMLTGATAPKLIALLLPLLALLLPLFYAVAERSRLDVRRRMMYRCTVYGPVKSAACGFTLRFVFLPHETLVCLHGIFAAIIRMWKKRKLLEWVTAADASRMKTGSWSHILRRMLPSAVIGASFALLCGGWASSGIAAVWLLSPAVARLCARAERRPCANEDDKRYIKSCAEQIWGYFRDNMTEKTHFLPPDNVQEAPDNGVAERTSPTNIGLAILSVVAACDLGIILPKDAERRIENCIFTLEKLKKWRGHFYNWYSTATTEPLQPECVSTVDSGNLCCALIAAQAAANEHGWQKLAKRCRTLAQQMDFAALYDAKKRLFRIGWEISSDEPMQGWYDLFASEARATSYMAVARGIVEKRHWEQLGRPMTSAGAGKKRHFGMLSWTGSMFEYLMPELLLPCYENSMTDESHRFAVACQMACYPGMRADKTWGTSESGYYAFDREMNYQYKAHGAARLGMKAGLDGDTVVSPYSSFLALEFSRGHAENNLRRLEKLGMRGKYGFYEAMDFTARRTGGDARAVRSYMAHHLGMSMVAAANYLEDGIMRKRFMADPEMRSCAVLLQEKVPISPILLNYRRASAEDRIKRPAGGDSFTLRCADDAREDAFCALLSNGSVTVAADKNGHLRLTCGDISLTRFLGETRRGSFDGVGFFISDGNSTTTLTPMLSHGGEYDAVFSQGKCMWLSRGAPISSELTVMTPEFGCGVLWRVILENNTARTKKLKLSVCFEPVMARDAEYIAHPAFSKLFISGEITADGALFKRRNRNGEENAFLCFGEYGGNFKYQLSREKAFGMGGIRREDIARERETYKPGAPLVDPCLLGWQELELKPGAHEERLFAMFFGSSRQNVEESFRPSRRSVSAGLAALSVAAILKMDRDDMEYAYRLAGNALYSSSARRALSSFIKENDAGREALWSVGVSGDLPIILASLPKEGADDEDDGATQRLVRAHRWMSMCGAESDLVLITHDGGEYAQPNAAKIREELRAEGAENTLGARGGCHIIDASGLDGETFASLAAFASVYECAERAAKPEGHAAVPQPEAPPHDLLKPLQTSRSWYALGESESPCLEWGMVLANAEFGALAGFGGLGAMWYLNSRLNKLTPWENDPLLQRQSEKLELVFERTRYSPFKTGDGYPCNVEYGPGYIKWTKETPLFVLKTTAFTASNMPIRLITVDIAVATKERADASIYWKLTPLMGEDKSAQKTVFSNYNRKYHVMETQNPGNSAFPGCVLRTASFPEFTGVTCDAVAAERGELNGCVDAGVRQCVAMSVPLTIKDGGGAAVLAAGCAGAAQLRDAARDTQRIYDEQVKSVRETCCSVEISTPDKSLDAYINTFSTYQIYYCRLLARTSQYQNGGAYGFRDQLQDAAALAPTMPEVLKNQLFRAAQHQYAQGDVMHWWHETGTGTEKICNGVRTNCSDDLLWLPYCAARYVSVTGDTAALEEDFPFLSGEALKNDEHDRYERAVAGDERATLYEHCTRAIELVIRRGKGEHKLLKILGGDWNDGYSLVGAQGRGESTWLTMFASIVLADFAEHCDIGAHKDAAQRHKNLSAELQKDAENAWDGDWYFRGSYDDGKLIGSVQNEECRIDSLPQSFAVFAGCDANRTDMALDSAKKLLYDSKKGIIKLFDPPFEHGDAKPGYIRGYPGGVRENGGQYTHAAVWLAMAFFESGRCGEGYELMRAILPAEKDGAYRIEPYVIAADVYNTGRGGWSWYTGAAGWYRRLAVETMLGLSVRNGELYVEPRLPEGWDGYEAVWRTHDATLKLTVKRGATAKNKPIPLRDLRGEHSFIIEIKS